MSLTASLQLQYCHTIDTGLNKVHSIAISHNYQEIVIAGGNNRSKTPVSLQVYEIDTSNLVYSLSGHTADINYVAITPDDEKIVSASSDSTIRVWELETGKEIYCIPDVNQQPSPYDKTMKDPRLKRFVVSGTHHLKKNRKFAPFHTVAINPNGKSLITATNNLLFIYDLDTGKELDTLTASNRHYPYYALAISPDGNIVAGGGGSTYIHVWDLETKQETHTIRGHSFIGRSLCISPDGKTLVSGGDQRIKVWDLETGEAKLSFYGHADLIRGVVITPDGNTLISASDRFIKIWDLETGKKLNTIEAHDDAIRALALSSDGEILASGGVGGKVKIWRVVRE